MNRHSPVHPVIVKSGIGGVVFWSIGSSVSCVHEVGCSSGNTTLCAMPMFVPSKETFSPALIDTVSSLVGSPVSWKKLSPMVNAASAATAAEDAVLNVTVWTAAGALATLALGAGVPRRAAPDANAGIAMSATTAHASHGRTDFLMPPSLPLDLTTLWTE